MLPSARDNQCSYPFTRLFYIGVLCSLLRVPFQQMVRRLILDCIIAIPSHPGIYQAGYTFLE
jgi:hypothetical protein